MFKLSDIIYRNRFTNTALKMEFLLFLKSQEQAILNIIQQAGYSVEENTPLCLLGEQYFGFFKNKQKKVVICTNNAKSRGGYFINSLNSDNQINKTAIYIRRALRHEAVHIAQHCNNGNLIDLSAAGKLKIHPYKLEALRGSSYISKKKDHEYQAYLIEDRPRLIINSLKQYCL